MTEQKYRIRKTIDVTATADADGDIRIADLTGTIGGYYATPDGLRRAGFQVESIEPTPADDPDGTIREFEHSKDRIVKIGGRWMYVVVRESSWTDEVGDLLPERFPIGFSKTTVIHRPAV